MIGFHKNNAIQSMWIGKLSIMETLSIKSFLKNGHEYHLYTYDPIDAPEGCIVKNGEEILPRDRIFKYGPAAGQGKGSFSGFSNVFRYQLLFKKGGYWVDSDIVCLKPFDFGHYVFASEMKNPGEISLASCVIKAPAYSNFAKTCLEICSEKRNENLKWGEIGPDLVKHSVKENDLDKYVQPVSTFCPVNYFEIDNLIKPGYNLETYYAVHLWNEMWRRKNYDKNGIYPNSIYEQLKSRFL